MPLTLHQLTSVSSVKCKPPQQLRTLRQGRKVEQSAKLNIIILDAFYALCSF